MPLSLRRGTVTAISERLDGLVRAEVDGAPCIAYPRLTGPVALGDEVLVNTQARELELGSGGFDILYANLTRGLGLAAEDGAHVMKLPYTPGQFAASHVEEGAELPRLLDGLPVVCCSLHSQVAPVCAALAGLRVAYVQLQGGALPLALSDTLRRLRERGFIEATASVGACFGGDVECVTPWAALAWAAAFDVAVCAIGPGVVGTGSRFGHGGMAAAAAINAALELGGRPILALRLSEADPRSRHRGVSHHTEALLELWAGSFEIPWPAGVDVDHPIRDGATEVDTTGWREACEGLPLSHMGRGPDEDPAFFAAAYAAGKRARDLLG